MTRCSRTFVCFAVVCLLASSCVWAIPGAKKSVAPEPQEQQVVHAVTLTTETSESEATEKSISYEELSAILNKAGWFIGGSTIDKISAGVDAIQATNDEQNAEIARLAAALKKEQSTKFFADFGAAFGFQAEKVQYGVTGDMGIRFGKGLMVKTGAQYMLGNVGKLETPHWDIEDLSLTCTVGWEW